MHAPTTLAAAGVPSLIWTLPFLALLLCVAILPLVKSTAHWWHANTSKLLVSGVVALVVLVHYATRNYGVHLHADPVADAMKLIGCSLLPEGSGWSTAHGPEAALGALLNALWEYIPFIVMLFSLYCVAGGVALRGRLPSSPLANTALLALGGIGASLIGTTGASILLIRPLLNAISVRQHRVHTIVFFIFIVANIGGTMLPIGDPPLFLGFLKGVPFLWTLNLWKPWVITLGALLTIYFTWDTLVYRKERTGNLEFGAPERTALVGSINLIWLVLIVLAIATLSPGAKLPGLTFTVPVFLREGVMLVLVALSFLTTPRGLRKEVGFTFFPINEVAALFIGIFVALQVPLEILSARGAELGLTQPWHYLWATGLLSSFLDNAPTYAVFFQTALGAPVDHATQTITLASGEVIRHDLLAATSLGAVFMGANTYIGNGPNFMVKAIAEEAGIKMPGFFGYMLYSGAVLIPLFALLTLLMR